MVTITVEKWYGASGSTAVRARISAPSIERAVELAGPNICVIFPIDGETFFAPSSREGIDYGAMTPNGIEEAYEAGLPGARDAWMSCLMDNLGAEGFEVYALENGLV